MYLKLSLVFLFFSPSVQAGYDFSNITKAFTTFLGQDLSQSYGESNSSLADYYHLFPYAAKTILEDPKNHFEIVHVCNYDYVGNEIPVTYEPFIINNRGDSLPLFANGYYFVTHKDDAGNSINLIIQVSQATLTLYTLRPHQEMGNNFFKSIKSFESLFNPYRAGVLEIISIPEPPYNVFVFLKNVGEYNHSWDELILNNDLKQLSFDQTEGYLDRLPYYKKSEIAMKKGILLAGPPGTGKSFLAQILISSILNGDLKNKATFIVITARHLSDNDRIKLLYSGAKTLSPSVIFMEDIDLLGIKNRGSTSDNFYAESQLNELLNAMDGLIDSDYILSIGTTNQEKNVDKALTRSMRFGEHLYFGLPSFDERREFFNRFGLKKAVWGPDINDIWLASITENFSGADIIEVIRLAKKEAYLAGSWQNENLLLLKEHFLIAIEILKSEHGTLSLPALKRNPEKVRSYFRSLKLLENIENKIHKLP